MRALPVCVLVLCAATVFANVYFKETFDDSYTKRWVVSNWKKSDGTAGDWKHTAGDWYGDAEADKGIQTTPDARFYAISAKLPKPFSNRGKDLVLQFSVKHPQKIDCGGGYIKLLPEGTDQSKFGGDSDYYVMFGPDICGTSTKRVHVIFTYKGKNLLTKKTINCESDQLSHVYTLIVHPDNQYEVRIDNKKVQSGSLFEDWDFLPPKNIKDPNAKKPSDWVDQEKIDDPTDTKPADWESIPKQIPDPDAEKPEDWDDEADGAWEPPMIDNPEYKGEWKPKQVPNPAYKGKWIHPEIPNPDYFEDKEVYAFDNIGAVGFELWQVKSGSIFDNIIVTDSVSEAEEFFDQTYGKQHDAEKAMFDEVDKKKRDAEESERKRAEEERKKQDAEKDDDEDEDEEDEDDDEEKKTPPAAAAPTDAKKEGHDEL
jgi:calreticulin